jgi:hypothetical protein
VADVTTIAVVAARREDDAGRRGGGGCDVDIAIVAARRDDVAGRHRRCIILGRDDAPSHRTKCFFVSEPARMCVVCEK